MSELALQLIAKAKKEKWKRLDLGNCGLTELPSELFELRDLEELILANRWREFNHRKLISSDNKGAKNNLIDLSGDWFSLPRLQLLIIAGEPVIDLSPLSNLKSLTRLNCRATQVSDLSSLLNLESLTSFDCSSTKVSDLSPLSDTQTLRELFLNFTEVIDLSPLSGLNVLQELHCVSTQIRDLGPLSNLKTITRINCKGSQVSDLSPLLNLESLKRLSCASTEVSDLSPLSNLESLELLFCSSTQVSTLDPLSNLLNLQELDCSFTNISDLNPLSNLESLKRLYFVSTRVNDLSPLLSLESLKGLSCDSTQVSDLSPLSNLQGLEELSCSSTEVSDLSPLSNLKSMLRLNCKGAQVSDLSPLSNLESMMKLDFSYTKVSDLSPLSNLQALQELSCSSTEINDLSPLSNLESLQKLYCASTRVSDLRPLSGLQGLEELSCISTQISELSPLSSLKLLKSLFCNSTKVSDLSPLSDLKTLKELSFPSTQVNDLSPLSNLKSLQNLSCALTKVRDLSPVSNMEHLMRLDCSNTQVSDLNPLNRLSLLAWLSCYNSEVLTIPKTVVFLHSLKKINFGKSVQNIPSGLSSVEEIRAYFDQLESEVNPKPDLLFKVVLLGNGCVGKTSLIRRMHNGEEAILPTIEERTHAIQIKQFPLTSNRLVANIWDFGGQEIYHATHRLFLASRALFLVLWSGNHPRESNDEYYELEYWLDLILSEGVKSKVIVIQNRFGDEVESLPEGWYQMVEHYENQGLQLEPRPISVDCGRSTGIDQVIKQVRRSLEDMQEERQYQLPPSWVKIRERLLQEREEGVQVIPLSTFRSYEEVLGMDETGTRALLQFLHHNGILYYQYRQLNDDIILNQQWAVDALYTFLDRNGEHYVKVKDEFRGILPESYQPTLWPEPAYNEEQREILLGFMTSNEIGFEISSNQKGENKYLIPQLLPNDTRAVEYDRKRLRTTFWLKIIFPFLHPGITDRLLFRVRKLDYSSSTRNAIMIRDFDKNRGAYVAYLPGEGSGRSILIETEEKKFGEELLNEVAKLISLDRTQIMVSADGQLFIPLEEIRNAWQNKAKAIHRDGKEIDLWDYRQYLSLDREVQLFDDEVNEDILAIDPSLRYATTKEVVVSLFKAGHIEKAIDYIPKHLGAGDLLLLVSRLQNSEKEYFEEGIISREDRNIERNRFLKYLRDHWEPEA